MPVPRLSVIIPVCNEEYLTDTLVGRCLAPPTTTSADVELTCVGAGSRAYPEVKRRFEMDYRGLSYLLDLEYVATHALRPVLSVFAPSSSSAQQNQVRLPREKRERLYFIDSYKEADTSLSIFASPAIAATATATLTHSGCPSSGWRPLGTRLGLPSSTKYRIGFQGF